MALCLSKNIIKIYSCALPSYYYQLIYNHCQQQLITYMTSTLSILTLITLISFSHSQLKHERVQIVHSNQQHRNYFVRGNLPIDADKRFQMDQLGYVLTSLTGLQNYQLKVISFLNFLTAKETKNRYIEEKYFQKNPQKAQYKTQLILGSLIDPNYFSPSTAKMILAATSLFDLDQVDGLVSEIHEELEKGSNKIIFIHCSAGMDRTGLVAGSYKLKYLNYSLQEVLQENSKFGGPRKVMHSPFLNALKWFCLSHKDQSACK